MRYGELRPGSPASPNHKLPGADVRPVTAAPPQARGLQAAEPYDQVRLTVASICPCGSSVGTKISLGFSIPKGARLTSRQCLFGMINDTFEISGAAVKAASPIWNKVACTDGL